MKRLGTKNDVLIMTLISLSAFGKAIQSAGDPVIVWPGIAIGVSLLLAVNIAYRQLYNRLKQLERAHPEEAGS